MAKRIAFILSLELPLLITGCQSVDKFRPEARVDAHSVCEQASACLKAAVGYAPNPVVRAAAVEALQWAEPEGSLPWIRSALLDEHPGVRFSACLAVGKLKDEVALVSVKRLLKDDYASVQVGALYAMHQLGESGRTSELPTYLLSYSDPTVRRNAALVLGLLENKSAIKPLARAMKDRDPGVRQHALEAMARLGNAQARQELAFMSNSGVGTEEVFALQALAELRDPFYEDVFRYKLAQGAHVETRLVAARGLGLIGCDDGLRLAMRALRGVPPRTDDPDDPPEAQRLRASQLAAQALGAIGSPTVLAALDKQLEPSVDPRLQVSAARAILEIDQK